MQRNILVRVSHNIAYLYSAPRLASLLAVAAAFFWLFNVSSATFSGPSFTRTTGQAGFLDVMSFYTAEQAFARLEQYGGKGRDLYLYFLGADFIFILAYSLGFALLYTRAVRAKFGVSGAWKIPRVATAGKWVATCLSLLRLAYPGASLVSRKLSSSRYP